MRLQRGGMNEQQAKDFLSGYLYPNYLTIWMCERH
jgi:hypothetical protein